VSDINTRKKKKKTTGESISESEQLWENPRANARSLDLQARNAEARSTSNGVLARAYATLYRAWLRGLELGMYVCYYVRITLIVLYPNKSSYLLTSLIWWESQCFFF
jgi:hypothetical protein